ncbi:MAG: dGTP triphosphohydrolase [Rhodospirillaceae bacterium]
MKKANAKRLYAAGDHRRFTPESKLGKPVEKYRSDWRRDYARVVHSPAFRRLQGKTQLFPNHETDFFRNRLTHSIEVAQIAKSIAIKLNAENRYLRDDNRIDTDIVELAGLCHDLGHPPFGHNGEMALDECMFRDGGFEGNAQSLRILAKLEKKATSRTERFLPVTVRNGKDRRTGLNLTARSIASVLKYDEEIPTDPAKRKPGQISKGYYNTERGLVRFIKEQVCGDPDREEFKTIECCIMDVADDIAYSTYDIEDAFKANFLSPMKMASASSEILQEIAKKVEERIAKEYPNLTPDKRRFEAHDALQIVIELFQETFLDGYETFAAYRPREHNIRIPLVDVPVQISIASEAVAQQGYFRTKLTSSLVGEFIRGVTIKVNEECPALSSVKLRLATFKKVEVLKNFAYHSLIGSSRLKVAEYRGKDIVRKIFEALAGPGGAQLMPEDFRELHSKLKSGSEQRRVICDFIAGMTDRYALEFYSRLFGTNAETIYKPL